MTIRVTMLTSRYAAGGSLLAAGQTYSLADAFAQELIGGGFATDTDGALRLRAGGLTPPRYRGAGTSAQRLLLTDLQIDDRWDDIGSDGSITPSRYNGAAWFGGGKGERIASPSSSLRMFGGYVEKNTAGYANRTFRLIANTPAPFNAIRLWMCNVDAAAYSVTAKVSASTTYNTSGPVGGAWYNALKNNSLTLSPGPTDNPANPKMFQTDWIHCPSVARADGGSKYLIYLDVFSSAGLFTSLTNTSNPNGLLTSEDPTNYYRGMILNDLSAAGNVTGTSFSGQAGWGSPIIGVEFAHSNNVLTVHAFNDSRGQGDGASIPLSGPVLRACADLSASTGRAVIPANHGFSSQPVDSFLERERQMADLGMLRGVVVFAPYSPNNRTDTRFVQADFDAMKEMAYRSLQLHKRSDLSTLPIFESSTPRTGFVALEDSLRVAFDAWLKSFCSANGAIFCDYSTSLSQGSGPAIYIPSLSGDGLHPNDGGYDVMASVLAGCIKSAAPWYFV